MRISKNTECLSNDVGVAVGQSGELLFGGPPHRLQRSLGLINPGDPKIALRSELVVLVGWVSLVALAVAQSFVLRNQMAKSFFSDFAVYARSLVAAPLLILAEAECIPRLGRVARHFLEAGLITEPDQARFDAAVTSTKRLLGSVSAELIFILLFFGWLWRVFLWARFLWLMSRLDLRLIPSHPDHAGRLMFLGDSLWAFWLVSFALGAVVAGQVANRMTLYGESLATFKHIVIGLVVLVMILFVGPLALFIGKLRETRRRGDFEYGALAGEVGRQFERDCLNSERGAYEQGPIFPKDHQTRTRLTWSLRRPGRLLPGHNERDKQTGAAPNKELRRTVSSQI